MLEISNGSTVWSTRSQRQRRLIDEVMARGSVSISELSMMLDVSVMTVHRDLDELQSQGFLRKSRGVATALSSSVLESVDGFRRNQQPEEKLELAAAAFAYIEPGQSILLDDSTTVVPLLEMLPQRTPLTVVSNSLGVTKAIAGVEGIILVTLGGEYVDWCNSFLGKMTLDAIQGLQVDLAIVSTAAIIGDSCFNQSQDTTAVKRAMMDVSEQRILLVDHTKFGRRALHRLSKLNDFDVVIVGSRTPDEVVQVVRDTGVNVQIARPRVARA
jgi:DeoR/GlpR family transcriptional regulator of sugar metabolism